jgi:hypothetical protein
LAARWRHGVKRESQVRLVRVHVFACSMPCFQKAAASHEELREQHREQREQRHEQCEQQHEQRDIEIMMALRKARLGTVIALPR